jgi:hypothetical protein
MHQFNLRWKQFVDAVLDDGMRLPAADLLILIGNLISDATQFKPQDVVCQVATGEGRLAVAAAAAAFRRIPRALLEYQP